MRRTAASLVVLAISCASEASPASDSSTSSSDTTAAGTTDTGMVASTGAGTTTSTAASDGGSDDPDSSGTDTSTGAPSCPSAPPFDDGDAALVAACTRRIYLEGGDDSRLTFSTDDGASWASVALADIDGDDFVNGVFVMGGIVGAIGLFGLYVDDGSGFVRIEDVAHDGFATYGGQFSRGDDGLWLLDNEGTYRTDDATSWLRVTPGGGLSDGFGGHFHGTAYGDGTHVIAQDAAYRSYDGTTWTETPLAGEQVTGLAFADGTFVMMGVQDGHGFTRTSGDGRTWSAAQTSDDAGDALGNLQGLVHDGTAFMAFTVYQGGDAYRSVDGTTWTRVATGQSLFAVTRGDGVYLGSDGAALYTSDDGVAWSPLHVLADGETSFINGPRVVVGRVLPSWSGG